MSTAAIDQTPWVPHDTFGLRLRILRAELGLSVDEIAAQCGVASATWSTWERGANPRGMDRVVQAICENTGVSREWLMWGGLLDSSRSRCFSETPCSDYVELTFDFEGYEFQPSDDHDITSQFAPSVHAA